MSVSATTGDSCLMLTLMPDQQVAMDDLLVSLAFVVLAGSQHLHRAHFATSTSRRDH